MLLSIRFPFFQLDLPSPLRLLPLPQAFRPFDLLHLTLVPFFVALGQLEMVVFEK
jgi:hypothetical protein